MRRRANNLLAGPDSGLATCSARSDEKALGIATPHALLTRVDEVIE